MTFIHAAIRFINADNAASCGYTGIDYDADYDGDGLWVLEEGDEWSADLPGIAETDLTGAQGAAEEILGYAGTWELLPANYGTAYAFHTA
jgi:hypothetical protein